MVKAGELQPEVGLRIGAAARLTGVSVHTLRKWEDRYAAVRPQRSSGGERLYSREDLRRLALMKRLADAGMSLRELAALDAEQLEQSWGRLIRERPDRVGGMVETRAPRVATVGTTAPRLLARAQSATERIKMVAEAGSGNDLPHCLDGAAVDVLICELPTIQSGAGERLTELASRAGARAVVALYGFGAEPALNALRRPGISLLRAPTDPDALVQAAIDAFRDVGGAAPCVESPPAHPAQDPPPPRLSLETIARISEASPRVQCECPRHLADLVFELRAFEDYSAACESRSTEDAALHRYLWKTTGHARALFEEALTHIARAEGIELD
jgi:DNA-binding transcriptional MerR regulator